MGARPGEGRPRPARAFYRRLRERLTRRAELDVQLGVPQGDGASLRRHLESALRATGEADPRLAESLVEFPRSIRGLWHAFLDLSATRHDGAPISYLELEAWERRNVRLSPWEADTLLAMDQAALAVPQKGNG